MSEIVSTYLLSKPDEAIPMDRDEFYAEQIQAFKNTGTPTRAVDVVDVIIFNSAHEMLIQKRSFDKAHNAGLLDKSIGGHLRYGDTPDYTVMVETVQELQTPSIVLRDDADFKKTEALLRDYLDTVALIKHHTVKIMNLQKAIKGETIDISNRVHLYFGLYNGRIRPVDREAKGVLWYSMNELAGEIEKFPDTFSADLRTFLREFRADIEEFLKRF